MHHPPNPLSVFFDLDGTLVKSAEGIMASLQYALSVCDVATEGIDWQTSIGPPLPQMLRAALPDLPLQCHSELIGAYRRHYAEVGLYMTTCFSGIPELLQHLAKRDARIYVVTNKPQEPAEAILRHLKLDRLVHRVVGGDPSGRVSKPERAAILVNEEKTGKGVFVGDGVDDLEAAAQIGARFFLAGWGYGTSKVLATNPHTRLLTHPGDLITQVEDQS